MKALVLDGYTDEPACLGVPPFISPYARLAHGALLDAGATSTYTTIDQYRSGTLDISRFDLVAIIRNLAVPGRYLRGMPASDNELLAIRERKNGKIVASLGVALPQASPQVREAFDHIVSEDLDATLFDLVSKNELGDRRHTYAEWQSWLTRGADACRHHPDFEGPLIAEVQMYRGCVRYISGGWGILLQNTPLYPPLDRGKSEGLRLGRNILLKHR